MKLIKQFILRLLILFVLFGFALFFLPVLALVTAYSVLFTNYKK